MNSLEDLSFYDNEITGPIPGLGGFSSLKVLYLGENRLNGTINKSLSRLYKLENPSLDGNSFTGVISDFFFFFNMSNLQILYLADNSDFEIGSWFGSSFSTEIVKSCHLQDGTTFFFFFPKTKKNTRECSS